MMLELDYLKVAKQLMLTLDHYHPDFIMTDEENEHIVFIANILERILEPELIHEYKDSLVGRGILIGMISFYYVYLGDEHDGEERICEGRGTTLPS